jgi:hypothetical protein
MANFYYGLNQGQGEFDAQVGTSSASTDVELFVNGTTAGIGRQQVEMAIEYLQDALIQQPWPYAASGSVYLGLNVGQGLKDVVVGASTNSTDFELRINCVNVAIRNEAYVLGEVLENVVLRNAYPPA